MCTLAILYRVARGTPILVAANREERFDRPTQYPKIQSGSPRVVCGTDRRAGGTWLGVNQNGLFCAVANRRRRACPPSPAPVGCSAANCSTSAAPRKRPPTPPRNWPRAFTRGPNFVCADGRYAAVVHGGDKIEIVELSPGLHIVSGGNVDDPKDERHEFVRRMLTLQMLDSSVAFLAVASRVFSRKPDSEGRRGVVVLGNEFGTVSSTLLSLPRKIQHAIYQYTPGALCDYPYDDLSALLRQVLSTERSLMEPRRQRRKPEGPAEAEVQGQGGGGKIAAEEEQVAADRGGADIPVCLDFVPFVSFVVPFARAR